VTAGIAQNPTRDEAIAAQAAAARHYTMRLAGRLSIAVRAEDQQDGDLLGDGSVADVLKSLAWIISDNCQSVGAMAHWAGSHGRPDHGELAGELLRTEADLKRMAHNLARMHRTVAGLPNTPGSTPMEDETR
jgi:hypothetical protein